MNNELKLQVGVKVLLKNSEGKYLLLRRNTEKYPEVGDTWDIVGGRIDPGFPLFENLQREVYEETKLNLLEAPKLVAAQDILRPDKHVVRLTYIGSIEGQPVLDEEHNEYRWFSASDLRSFDKLDPFFKEILDRGLIQI
jgi:8-oxo-dGTP diphosphatase